VVWAFVAVMVYFLSYGPAELMLMTRNVGPRTSDAIAYIYWPWSFVYFNTPLHKPLGLYMHLWNAKFWDKDGEIRVRFD
jgi:hypothetical protein